MPDFAALRAAVLVADVLAAHGYELRDGRMACPLCGARNPSTLSVTRDGRRWRCWSCGAHGDAADLEAALSACDVGTAARRLAARVGLADGPRPTRDCIRQAHVRRSRERMLCRWAALACRDAIDVARAHDVAAHRLGITGTLEMAAHGAVRDATLDALARIYIARDRAECDVDWFAAADLADLADGYHAGGTSS